ncbi:MAG: type II toxin-antitoxin system VapC family toxin [Akkermansiaceae bacterium]|nr:type II toxin-antitoxin system VapC family toxin [Akkermansiaceae bacterium]NNM29456.1 type II toxin-antitoxin system VapC family toxin [Akkermansiaceae bacterium]
MTLLLDTRPLLLFLSGAPELPNRVAEAIEGCEVMPLVSIVSMWEMAVKMGIGKLRLPYTPGDQFAKVLGDSGFELLALGMNTLERAATLPSDHSDPFDRLLAAEALAQDATVVSADGSFDRLGVPRLW